MMAPTLKNPQISNDSSADLCKDPAEDLENDLENDLANDSSNDPGSEENSPLDDSERSVDNSSFNPRQKERNEWNESNDCDKFIADAVYTVDANQQFADLGVCDWLNRSLHGLAIERPTQIQQRCIPLILQGRDCIGIAKTGSGKTAAYAVPLLQQWSEDPFGIYALVLAPTRELVLQIAEQFKALGSSMNVRVTSIVGGMDIIAQALALSRRPHFVIATPGRLADILRTNGEETLAGFGRIKALVLDEADRLLLPTFADELADCLRNIPPPQQRQSLLLTATITDAIRSFSSRAAARKIEIIEIGAKIRVNTQLRQYYLLAPSHMKIHYLYAILTLPQFESKSVIIFVNRTKGVEEITRTLKLLGIKCTAMHSLLPQRERSASLGRFRAEVVRALIATDVASRGLDIPTVDLVINIDIPRDPNDYIHRVGRTARAGRPGEAVSIVSERDADLVHSIEDNIGSQLEELATFSQKKVVDNLNRVSTTLRKSRLAMADEHFGLQTAKQRRSRSENTKIFRKSRKD